MRLRSRMTSVVISAAVMFLSGMLVVGAAELVPTTKDIENNKNVIEEVEVTDSELEEVAEVEAVTKETVMETMPETKAEPETETEPVTSEFDGKFMVNIDEYLNIRASADENAEVVGKLYAGAGGIVIEKGAEWTKISSGSVEGYAATQYLLFDADAEVKANEVGALKATLLEDSIRVRKLPSTEAGVWGLAGKDEVYTASKVTDDGWVEINYDGETGYISSEFVEVKLIIGTAVSKEEEQEQIRIEEERQAAIAAEAARKEEEAKAEAKKIAAASQFVETVQTTSYNVSEDDVYLLACLVCAEAGYEPYEGKLAVANVVLNRLNGGSYGGTMTSVIYASGQFSVAASGRLATVMAQGPNAESITAAKDALAGTNNVPYYTNFRSCGAANYNSYNNYSIIGNQVFFN